MSGVACALTMGVVGMANFDLPALIPIPLVAGLVFYLAYSFIFDALWRPYQQRAWFDLALAVTIAIVCLQYGYLTGVLAGVQAVGPQDSQVPSTMPTAQPIKRAGPENQRV